jgi:pectate lyase
MRFLCLALLAGPSAFALQDPPKTPAFPGAEGAGALARGGRGGRVIIVTHLGDSGPGSLREAVEAEGPRIVLFRVAGLVELKSPLKITHPFLTIAGQTAPGGGICIQGFGCSVQADDVVVRHLRFRPGDVQGKATDALSVFKARRVILDHCSASWSVDESLSVTGEGCSDVTVQWCLISESLNKSVHAKGEHGFGSLIRTDGTVSFHHNLYAHHSSRCPRPGTYGTTPGLLDFRNNVIYNWGARAGYSSDDPALVNYVGNYLKPGPSTRTPRHAFRIGGPATRLFVADNFLGEPREDPWSLITHAAAENKADKAFAAAAVATDPPEAAFAKVLERAGATRPDRDAIDLRVVEEVRQGAGRIIDSQRDVGGWPSYPAGDPPADGDGDGMPDEWEKQHGLAPADATDGILDADSDGYTNIEEFLNDTDPNRKS